MRVKTYIAHGHIVKSVEIMDYKCDCGNKGCLSCKCETVKVTAICGEVFSYPKNKVLNLQDALIMDVGIDCGDCTDNHKNQR